jgi:hypothetical protein
MMTEDAPGGHRDEHLMTYREFNALSDHELRRRIEAPGATGLSATTASRTIGTRCSAARPRSRMHASID